jgi:hypothetical protein
VQHDERLRALAELIDAFEAAHGVIAPEEIETARARAKARAVVVGRVRAPARPTRKRREVA